MRPWTLHPSHSNDRAPLLLQLRRVACDECGSRFNDPDTSVAQVSDDTGIARPARDASDMSSVEQGSAVHPTSSAQQAPQGKRRKVIATHTPTPGMPNKDRNSYVAAWNHYIDGHIVSESNRRYVTNLLAATAARVVEDSDDSSAGSDDFNLEGMPPNVGDLDLIEKNIARHCCP